MEALCALVSLYVLAIIARAIQAVFDDTSVSEIFDGNNLS